VARKSLKTKKPKQLILFGLFIPVIPAKAGIYIGRFAENQSSTLLERFALGRGCAARVARKSLKTKKPKQLVLFGLFIPVIPAKAGI